jgi:hypothetical protein
LVQFNPRISTHPSNFEHCIRFALRHFVFNVSSVFVSPSRHFHRPRLGVLADAVSAAAAHEAAKITTAEVAVTKAERTISEAQVVEQEREKGGMRRRKKKVPAYKKFGLAFPIKALQPYAAAAPHMTEKDWADMPLPLHGECPYLSIGYLPRFSVLPCSCCAEADLCSTVSSMCNERAQ